MKRYSQCKLTKGLNVLLFTFGVTILLLYSAIPDYYRTLHVQAQLQQQQPQQPIIGIKIISPTTGQQVPVGELTISGTSTDNATTDCTVYVDWNNTKPFETAVATGPAGVNDYSRWTFTYTDDYHLITNGTNNLTSKLSCVDANDSGTANLTKSYSVNVIGITESSERQALEEEEEQQNNGSSDFSSSPSLPSVKRGNDDNNNTAATITTPPEDPTIYWDLEDFD
jgi:hypothetical protein